MAKQPSKKKKTGSGTGAAQGASSPTTGGGKSAAKTGGAAARTGAAKGGGAATATAKAQPRAAGTSRKPGAIVGRPVVVTVKSAAPTAQQIAQRAYQIWDAAGRPVGRDQRNWAEAEAQLLSELND